MNIPQDEDWVDETEVTTVTGQVSLVDSDGNYPENAELPNSSKRVILNGVGTGMSVTIPPERQDKPSFSIRSRDEALSSNAPLFIIHSPHQKRDLMPRLLASVLAATQGSISAAAAVGLPKGTDDALSSWLDSCTAASIRMADPMNYLVDDEIVRVRGVSERSLRWRPYLGKQTADIAELLTLQRNVGANLLLTSGRALDPSDPQIALDAVSAEGDDALAELLPGERLALNLTLPATWLSNPTLRSKLLAHLLDHEQFDIWHIRVQWQSNLRSLQQPVSEDLLQGYKRLSQLAADEDRVLLLPQTGLSGWLQLAFGAAGFGTGLFGAGQAFKEETQGGNGGQPEMERYFEPSLLHPVERAVHDALRQDSQYIQCNCPYCPSLHSQQQWSHDLARLHLMYWQGHLSGVAATRGRTQEAAIRKTVRTALQASTNMPLAGISVPRHLQAWDRLL